MNPVVISLLDIGDRILKPETVDELRTIEIKATIYNHPCLRVCIEKGPFRNPISAMTPVSWNVLFRILLKQALVSVA